MPRDLGEDPFATWAPARLIPTAGIRGQEEQERRATSAFLAVLKAVPEFAHALRTTARDIARRCFEDHGAVVDALLSVTAPTALQLPAESWTPYPST